MLKRSSIRHSDPTLSQKRGELRHCGGIIPLFRENQSTRGLAALYSTRLPARSIAAVPVIDIYTRFGQTVSQMSAVRVSPDISMNKVTSVTPNFRAPRSIPPPVEIPLSTNHPLQKHRNSRHNISQKVSPRIFSPFFRP